MSLLTSTKTGTAPRATTAFATDTNVNDGTITSSPGPSSNSNMDISSAWVQDGVSRQGASPTSSANNADALCVKGPSPVNRPDLRASEKNCSSRPVR